MRIYDLLKIRRSCGIAAYIGYAVLFFVGKQVAAIAASYNPLFCFILSENPGLSDIYLPVLIV